MITALIIIVFVLGYIAIALEHPLKLNKAASALITGVLCWTIYTLQSDSTHTVSEELLKHLGEMEPATHFSKGELPHSHRCHQRETDSANTFKRQNKFCVCR